MINIAPYQERLIWLKEWINIKVNAWMLISIIDLYKEEGHLMYYHKDELAGFTFEKYCKLKEANYGNQS